MSILTTKTTNRASAPDTRRPQSLVGVDLYRDIHKGIRAELFDLTREAASADPNSRIDLRALADHVRTVGDLLISHAKHEDLFIQPVLEIHVPEFAGEVAEDHESIDGRVVELVEWAASLTNAPVSDARTLVNWLQLELAAFTADFLKHQDLEERQIMPVLEGAIGPEAALEIHGAIVASIPPDELVRSLAVMLPAMNIEDRTELLGGIKAGAPAEVFDGLMNFSGSVLPLADFEALSARLSCS